MKTIFITKIFKEKQSVLFILVMVWWVENVVGWEQYRWVSVLYEYLEILVDLSTSRMVWVSVMIIWLGITTVVC